MADKPALRPGLGETTLGDYGLLSEIQKDPIGPLWVGRRAGDDDSRSLVLIRPVAADRLDGETPGDLEKAATWAQQLEHEALLPVADFVSDDDRLGIVSQYVEGELLSVLLFRTNVRRQHFPVPVVLRIVLDLLDGLAYLHAQKAPEDACCFGTLSPESVYIGLDGRSRILEPGVAAVLATVDDWGQDAKRLAYRAPEQLDEAGEVGPVADLFTVGAILWEMLAKRRLVAGSKPDVIAKSLAELDVPRVDSLKGPGIRAITEELANVVAQALERTPDARLDSAEAFASGLRGAGAKVGEHEEVARFVDELHGQTLLERHRKIEQAVAPPRSSDPGAPAKAQVASPGPFAATPSSKGKDEAEQADDSGDAASAPAARRNREDKSPASSRVLLGRRPAPPRPGKAAKDEDAEDEAKGADDEPAAEADDEPAAEANDKPAKKAKAAEPPKKKAAPPKAPRPKPKGAPPPPKRGKAPAKEPEPPAEDLDDQDEPASRKESAVVTMPAPRSQLARRRRPSQEKMKAALPGSKASKSVRPPPGPGPDDDAAKAPADEPAAEGDGAEGQDDVAAAAGSDPAAAETKPDQAEPPADSDGGEDGKAGEPAAAAAEPAEPKAKGGAPKKDGAPAEGDAAEPAAEKKANKPGKDAPAKAKKKPTKADEEPAKAKKAPPKDERKPKAAKKPTKGSDGEPAAKPAVAVDLDEEQPKSRLPMLALLAAVAVVVILVVVFRSGSDETAPTPGAGTPTAKPQPQPPPERTAEPRPTEPEATEDVPATAPPAATSAAPTADPVTPQADPTVAPPKPPTTTTAPPAKPKPPKPPTPKPPPVKPPPPKPTGEFDPGGI